MRRVVAEGAYRADWQESREPRAESMPRTEARGHSGMPAEDYVQGPNRREAQASLAKWSTELRETLKDVTDDGTGTSKPPETVEDALEQGRWVLRYQGKHSDHRVYNCVDDPLAGLYVRVARGLEDPGEEYNFQKLMRINKETRAREAGDPYYERWHWKRLEEDVLELVSELDRKEYGLDALRRTIREKDDVSAVCLSRYFGGVQHGEWPRVWCRCGRYGTADLCRKCYFTDGTPLTALHRWHSTDGTPAMLHHGIRCWVYFELMFVETSFRRSVRS